MFTDSPHLKKRHADLHVRYDFNSIRQPHAVQLERERQGGRQRRAVCGPLWGSGLTEIAEVGFISYAKATDRIYRFTFDEPRYRLSISIRIQISAVVPIVRYYWY